MELEEGLKEFLQEAIEEEQICTVEGSFSRMLTKEEMNYLNEQLQPYGYAVNCFRCKTCEEYSNGENPFHIERTKCQLTKN